MCGIVPTNKNWESLSKSPCEKVQNLIVYNKVLYRMKVCQIWDKHYNSNQNISTNRCFQLNGILDIAILLPWNVWVIHVETNS